MGRLEELNGWVKVSSAAEVGRAFLADVRAGAKPGDMRQPTVLHKGLMFQGQTPCLWVESHRQTNIFLSIFFSWANAHTQWTGLLLLPLQLESSPAPKAFKRCHWARPRPLTSGTFLSVLQGPEACGPGFSGPLAGRNTLALPCPSTAPALPFLVAVPHQPASVLH